MKKPMLLIPILGMMFSGCGIVNESMRGLEINRQEIDMNTNAIYGNIQAIEEANRSIENNRHQLEEVNKTLQKVRDSEKS